jgi:hypothetical protein
MKEKPGPHHPWRSPECKIFCARPRGNQDLQRCCAVPDTSRTPACLAASSPLWEKRPVVASQITPPLTPASAGIGRVWAIPLQHSEGYPRGRRFCIGRESIPATSAFTGTDPAFLALITLDERFAMLAMVELGVMGTGATRLFQRSKVAIPTFHRLPVNRRPDPSPHQEDLRYLCEMLLRPINDNAAVRP